MFISFFIIYNITTHNKSMRMLNKSMRIHNKSMRIHNKSMRLHKTTNLCECTKQQIHANAKHCVIHF